MKREGFLRLFSIVFLCACTTGLARAHAAESIAENSTSEQSTKDTQFYLGVENQFYRTAITPSWFPVGKLGVESHHRWNEYESNINGELRASIRDPKAFSPYVQNAYIGELDQSYESPLRLSYGRRHLTWSEMDEMWSLGNIQPLDAWDRLRPRSQGLTGIFAYTETQKLYFRMFFSYIALPEMTPNVILENNRFVPDHPQAISSPPQTVSLLNHTTPLGYNIDIPSINKIIFRPSFAFMVETKPEIPVEGRLMYGYLPLNYFPLAIQGDYSIPNDQIPVDIHPRLVQHHVYSGDLGYRFSDHFRAGFGTLIDQPTAESYSTDYTYAPLSTSVTTSPWIKYEWPQFKLILTHVWINGGVDEDTGKNPGLFHISSHVFYRSASQVATEFTPHYWEDLSTFIVKYIHEYSIRADWIAVDYLIRTREHWSFVVGADLIAATKDIADTRGAEFLADMKALDRVRLGVTYAF